MQDMPEGALTRYYRDVYTVSKQTIPFEEFVEQEGREHEAKRLKLNREHPVLLDKKIRLDEFRTIHFFLREGESLSCHFCDMAQNGGEGYITLKDALERIERRLEGKL